VTTIKATCPACLQSVSLWSADVLLTVCPDPAFSNVGFRCPRCFQQVTAYADAKRVALLRAEKVREISVHRDEADDAPMSGAMTLDDLIAFGLALEKTPNGRNPKDDPARAS
jgi:hypothetical protein